jgi:soluble lytic murein transglycosylase-like protein
MRDTVGGMRHPMRRSLLLSLPVALALSAPAAASVPHVVAPGETLWQLAASNGFTTRSFAAANGLSPDARIVAGTVLRIPSVSEAAAALAARSSGTTASDAGEPGESSGSVSSAAPAPMGGYIVRPGDTLSALAARSRVSVAQMAYMNGLDPSRPLLAGTALKLPTGSPVATVSTAAARPSVVAAASPSPTHTRVSSADIAAVATRNGVPASIAQAIAWQESGFNNSMVSSANARGVMQVMPGTWDWVQRNLAKRQLDPASAIDNVGAGVLYLGNLLQQTGGDLALAAAGYYQGLDSVRRIGMLPETRQYVNSVLALNSRFSR